MQFSAEYIAKMLGGTTEGNPLAMVSRLSKIEEGTPGSLTFLSNPKYTHFIYKTTASIVIVSNDFKPEAPVSSTLIRVENPHESFVRLLEIYNQARMDKHGIDSQAFVSKTAVVGKDAYIGAFAIIGDGAKIGSNVKIHPQVYVGDNAEIKDNTTLFPGVKVYADCIIGSNCTLHAGVIIGGDGFGFTPQDDNAYRKVPQIGNVIIEDYVEIGSNTTIDRATIGSTIIRKGVKLDNLIQIAHNVEVGENTVIAAQTGIAGSAKIGRDCMIGGQVGIVGHISIADKVKIAAKSGIASSIINEGEVVQGAPAFGIGDYKRAYVLFKKLPELEKRIKELEQALAEAKSG